MCLNDKRTGFLMNNKENATYPGEKRSLRTQELFRGARQLLIEHNGTCYRLCITRQNKLILTK